MHRLYLHRHEPECFTRSIYTGDEDGTLWPIVSEALGFPQTDGGDRVTFYSVFVTPHVF